MNNRNQKLFSKSYCAILGANFLLFFAFYLIMPILPFFLKEEFNTANDIIGLVLACYTIATLTIRPFAGYLLDALARKPLYLITFFLFVITFGGYPLSISLAMITFFRAIHGLSFGIVTVASNTIVIDIMPSERRGEGLGYYGLSNNIAMAIGPMVGLFLHSYYSYDIIFICSLTSGLLGLILATLVKSPYKAPKIRPAISLDRFILLKGIPAGIALLMLSIPYGITSTYIAVYSLELNITLSTGLFFTSMASGMMISRLFAGKFVDRGYITQTIKLGMVIASICYLGLALCKPISVEHNEIATIMFFTIAFLVGGGFGIMFPAFNSMFICLAEHNQRGTATSTYLTSWDVGIGIGLILGGVISKQTSFSYAYLLGGALCIISTIIFILWVTPHFNNNRIQ